MLSRNPVDTPTIEDRKKEDELQSQVNNVKKLVENNHEDIIIDDITSSAKNDQDYQKLVIIVKNGFPNNRNRVPDALNPC